MGEILGRTRNFLRLYRYACGKGEVPEVFHTWSCLSLLAACVADRVQLDWIKGQPIAPNIYVFLIAPSGIGKNVSCMSATQYVLQPEWVEQRVNLFRGKLTPQFLHDKLGQRVFDEGRGEYVQPNSKIWFVTPELTQGMGKGELAESLIENMTELFSCGSTTIRDGTRTRGELVVKDPCINWLAGTTKEWLVDAVKPKGIKSGFFARVIPVHYTRLTPEEAVWKPRYPDDWERIVAYLRARVQALCYTQGTFVLEPEADAYGRQWYDNRPKEEDEYRAVFWNRTKEMMFKLAMLLALSDGGGFVIKLEHLQRAKKMYEELQGGAQLLVELACQTPQTKPVKVVRDVLEKVKRIGHSKLQQRVHRFGVDRRAMAEAVSTLRSWGEVKVEATVRDGPGRPGVVYVWMGKD